MKWMALAAVASVAWYTFNSARLAWQSGQKGGAFIVGLLALVTFALPTVLLFKQ